MVCLLTNVGLWGHPMVSLVGHNLRHMGVARYAPIPQRTLVLRPSPAPKGCLERPTQWPQIEIDVPFREGAIDTETLVMRAKEVKA